MIRIVWRSKTCQKNSKFISSEARMTILYETKKLNKSNMSDKEWSIFSRASVNSGEIVFWAVKQPKMLSMFWH